tara:strand:+ start:151 stop:474 length:324 start_codon:yes stop_codon:yes gene_type:complete
MGFIRDLLKERAKARMYRKEITKGIDDVARSLRGEEKRKTGWEQAGDFFSGRSVESVKDNFNKKKKSTRRRKTIKKRQTTKSRFCSECGIDLDKKANFCSKCGKKTK